MGKSSSIDQAGTDHTLKLSLPPRPAQLNEEMPQPEWNREHKMFLLWSTPQQTAGSTSLLIRTTSYERST